MELWEELDRLRTGAPEPRVFGDPYETTAGTTIIPVSRIGGFGRVARPVGVFVVHDGAVQWAPATDHTRLALLAEIGGLTAAIIATIAVLRRPPWPDLSVRGLAALRERRIAARP
ncbi:hypothetical protein [Amycolatopsis minnesotensis]|uniref:Uncharacterized protein n=1 Tax=Amycolatopsis minnesotensis TaxID=337894 RepID=A0ABN2RTY8_9PSEU